MYRTIDSAFWTDPKIRKLNTDGKLLLIYLITNAHTHVSGIYYAPRLLIQHETGLPRKAIDTLCARLSELGFCRFDRVLEIVWVKNMMRYQGRGDKNIKSAAHHVTEDLHYSPLIAEFLAYYPEVKAAIPDRVLDRVSRVGTPEQDPRSLIPDPRFLNPDQEQEQELNTPSLPEKREGRPKDEAFELFASKHVEYTGTGYVSKKGDFVRLQALRKANHCPNCSCPDRWEDAVTNYFGSPLAHYTLADLCVRFPIFRNSPVDEFQKPTNHQGNHSGQRYKTKADRTKEAADRILARFDSKDSSGGEC